MALKVMLRPTGAHESMDQRADTSMDVPTAAAPAPLRAVEEGDVAVDGAERRVREHRLDYTARLDPARRVAARGSGGGGGLGLRPAADRRRRRT
eukprot:SAG11_NODE_1772_length_4273_cov_3.739578_8_plen_94_part_00